MIRPPVTLESMRRSSQRIPIAALPVPPTPAELARAEARLRATEKRERCTQRARGRR